jgi:hypothetical protein
MRPPCHVRAGFFWIAGAGAAGDETKSIHAQAQAQLQATYADEIDPLDSLHSFVRVFFFGGGP